MRTTRSLAASIVALVALAALAAGLARGSDEVRAPRPQLPPAVQPEADAGRVLYLQSCASCHGPEGGGTEFGPSLVATSPAMVDFQLTTGRMPFAGQPGQQAQRKPVAFSQEQITGLVDYVVSFGGTDTDGPAIPNVQLDDSLLSRGHQLYSGNCAPCHGATGNGGAVGGGSLAPALHAATPVQVVEAMLVGPGQMPRFLLGEADLNAVATYVDFLQGAPDPGGFSIGGIGPVPEGFAAWVLGAGLLLVVVYLIGRDWSPRRDESPVDPEAESPVGGGTSA